MPFVTLPEFSKKCPDLTLEEFRGVFGWSSSSLALTLFVYSLIDRPTAEEAKKWQTSFESVLRHKFGIQLFQEFLRSQYGEENLNFWLAVEEYKKLDESSRAERARMIYEDYVSTLSPTEVRHWFPPLFLFYLSRRLCHANFIFHLLCFANRPVAKPCHVLRYHLATARQLETRSVHSDHKALHVIERSLSTLIQRF